LVWNTSDLEAGHLSRNPPSSTFYVVQALTHIERSREHVVRVDSNEALWIIKDGNYIYTRQFSNSNRHLVASNDMFLAVCFVCEAYVVGSSLTLALRVSPPDIESLGRARVQGQRYARAVQRLFVSELHGKANGRIAHTTFRGSVDRDGRHDRLGLDAARGHCSGTSAAADQRRETREQDGELHLEREAKGV
jgi:hypothetical protein